MRPLKLIRARFRRVFRKKKPSFVGAVVDRGSFDKAMKEFYQDSLSEFIPELFPVMEWIQESHGRAGAAGTNTTPRTRSSHGR